MKAEATLPVHAMAPEVEPGDPVSKAMIAEAAYYRAEKRGFVHGMALEDWLEAEKEIEALARAAT